MTSVLKDPNEPEPVHKRVNYKKLVAYLRSELEASRLLNQDQSRLNLQLSNRIDDYRQQCADLQNNLDNAARTGLDREIEIFQLKNQIIALNEAMVHLVASSRENFRFIVHKQMESGNTEHTPEPIK